MIYLSIHYNGCYKLFIFKCYIADVIVDFPKKVKNTARIALILFLVNSQDSEVFKMVSFAIVACLDPTHWMFQVASISRNSSKCLQKLNKSTDFREIDATWNIQCVGSRRATIAKETNLKTSESFGLTKKRIRALRAVFLTFSRNYKKCYYIRM